MKSVYKKYLKTIAVIWAGYFVLFILVYMLMFVPQKKTRKLIVNEFAEKMKVYESALKASQKENQIKLDEQIKKLGNRLKDFVIDFEDAHNLIFDISQIAKEKNVTEFSIKGKDDRRNQKKSDLNYIRENHIDISFKAGFNQFAAFLNALERHRPVIFVDKFAIIRSDKGALDHKVKMSLVVFVKKQQGS